MDGFFSLKTFLRLIAAAIVLAAGIVLVNERIENSQPVQYTREIEVTRIVEQTVRVTSVVEKVITATPQPTEILPKSSPTSKPPTLTPEPEILAVLEEGLSIWCQPVTSYDTNTILPMGEMPQDAIPASNVNGDLTVITQVKSCTFLVKFNDPVPDGVRLKIQDLGSKPFIDVKMNPVEGDATLAYFTSDHYFIIDPPYWKITYSVSVYGPDNEKMWEKPVIFRREWIPDPCPNGLLPDPVTGICGS